MAVENFQQWVLDSQNGIESLVSRQAQVPKVVGEHEVLVRIHAASLNYRDLAIAKVPINFFTLLSPLANVIPRAHEDLRPLQMLFQARMEQE
jgi:NADPH:quinone reductase-like Zn-dependent oxidoreductase